MTFSFVFPKIPQKIQKNSKKKEEEEEEEEDEEEEEELANLKRRT